MNGRMVERRKKVGTSEIVDNMIHPLANKILKKYKSKSDYVVPIYKAPDYGNFRRQYSSRVNLPLKKAGVETRVSAKTPRYTFINIAKELMINRSITEEIVGHAVNDVHNIYETRYPQSVRDETHSKIIDAVLKCIGT